MNSKPLDKAYQDWFTSIKDTIAQARVATSVKVNNELLQLYFNIGNSILDVQNRLGWGSQIIDKLSAHIKK